MAYDFERLLLLSPGEPCGVPECVGPVEVALVPGKHRGLVTTRRVAQGELLLANRALAISETPKLAEAARRSLEHCSQEDFDAFFLLCDGRRTPQQLPKLQASEASGPVSPLRQRRVGPDLPVEQVLAANAHELDAWDSGPSAPKKSGLFLIASLINHSCLPTSCRIFMGDFIFVRAAKALDAGEEVTDGYISVLQPAPERRRAIKHYGFELHDDRIFVEEALFAESIVQRLLAQIDVADTPEALARIVREAEALVEDRMLSLASAEGKLEAAAQRLGIALQRVLLGSLAMPAQVAVGCCQLELGAFSEAARSFGRCCWLLEALAPFNSYHARWALDAFCAASLGKLPTAESYGAYARKVLLAHCGSAPAAELMARRRGLQLPKAEESEAPLPGEPEVTCELLEDAVELCLKATEPLELRALEIAVSGCLLDLRGAGGGVGGRLLLPLPAHVGEAKVRLAKDRRSLRAKFPRDEKGEKRCT
ncbi:unnamed protein product, partial [Effrenium voratum]